MQDNCGKVGDKISGLLATFTGTCLLQCGPTLSDSNRTKIIDGLTFQDGKKGNRNYTIPWAHWAVFVLLLSDAYMG